MFTVPTSSPSIKACARGRELVQTPEDRPKAVLLEMHRQVGDLRIDPTSKLAYQGLLVRHLVLPGDLAGSGKVMQFLAEKVSRNTYVNVMAQYRPCGRAADIQALAVALSPVEYDHAVKQAKAAGLTRLDQPRRVFQLW